jgi:hypothetical protein
MLSLTYTNFQESRNDQHQPPQICVPEIEGMIQEATRLKTFCGK